MTTDQKTIEYLLKRIEALEKENKMWENKFHEQNMLKMNLDRIKDSEFVIPENQKIS